MAKNRSGSLRINKARVFSGFRPAFSGVAGIFQPRHFSGMGLSCTEITIHSSRSPSKDAPSPISSPYSPTFLLSRYPHFLVST